jgi:hypothetical protein
MRSTSQFQECLRSIRDAWAWAHQRVDQAKSRHNLSNSRMYGWTRRTIVGHDHVLEVRLGRRARPVGAAGRQPRAVVDAELVVHVLGARISPDDALRRPPAPRGRNLACFSLLVVEDQTHGHAVVAPRLATSARASSSSASRYMHRSIRSRAAADQPAQTRAPGLRRAEVALRFGQTVGTSQAAAACPGRATSARTTSARRGRPVAASATATRAWRKAAELVGPGQHLLPGTRARLLLVGARQRRPVTRPGRCSRALEVMDWHACGI